MGFIGYFVKLIHIPINNILVYVRLPHPARWRLTFWQAVAPERAQALLRGYPVPPVYTYPHQIYVAPSSSTSAREF